MTYHAPSNQFTVSQDDIQRAAGELLWAIKMIREGHGLDPNGYKHEGPMDSPQFAENGILNAARVLGIDLGAPRYGMLDVSNAG